MQKTSKMSNLELISSDKGNFKHEKNMWNVQKLKDVKVINYLLEHSRVFDIFNRDQFYVWLNRGLQMKSVSFDLIK